MTVLIRGFDWDDDNVRHLEQAHPNISLDDLEDILSDASLYTKMRRDRFGKMVYGASRGDLDVLVNILPGNRARIFSVREG